VAQPPPSTRAERGRLLGREVEQLTVEAIKLGLTLDELQASVAERWRSLQREKDR
jgi:hypothetical protein